ncbi:valS [Wigglesworthia glossinidia endosymbiont of Glossina brevipalpis]|uniref:Valine--tRNA ligase n=1 Tax=Wigglesworthia glossinidia brevipalpis TaxID=36870 RepID=SYV_WIGBR|nr:RecName: Full=Valine--tRNA ligase; AltName: Full=Valyl-tRNA synthetase; Short=ValRS [Wigglesworthia glossinidia endosymbiont of Glossina brevipalpis]BAC24606.1 valS [Wigglesworthia glossinidia endosymbiont of Glossina brevipalpis]
MKNPYDSKKIESYFFMFWKKNNLFKKKLNSNKDNFCIILPPPNITGDLHVGHAFQQSIIDIFIRYNYMKGNNVLLQSGIDHAGISTQSILEKKIYFYENKNRFDYGRKNFIKEIWKWKEESEKKICYQINKLGCFTDLNKIRFTMDKDSCKAVNNVFLKLYKDKLIYKKKKLMHWDVKLRTVISDLEIENREINGKLWYIKYFFSENSNKNSKLNFLEIATTRPETIFGDVAVAVNPLDARYNNLIGKYIKVPLTNRSIPIIQDDYVKMDYGSGCVKITPGHDFNDFSICKNHKLNIINILTISGKICKKPKVYDFNGNSVSDTNIKIPKELQGLSISEARNNIVYKLNRKEYITKFEYKKVVLPFGDRSGDILEPMLTNQWYIKTKKLSEVAIEAVKEKKIKFISKQYENMYFGWMENIKDWCISRQLWWGHRIPIWYDVNKNQYPGISESDVRDNFKINKEEILTQEEDVLDTWFSSAIWSFASLGWPQKSIKFDTFHPTNLIISGFDIIYFWISRMIMLTMYIIKDSFGNPQIPFKNIFITGLIRDKNGIKMSKSKGNVIDPIDIIDGISLEDLIKKRTKEISNIKLIKKIEKITKKEFPNGIQNHGADAVRLSMASISCSNRKINIDIKKIIGYKNFCNKLWNVSKFIIINLKNKKVSFEEKEINLHKIDNWILHKYNKVFKYYKYNIDNFRLDLVVNILYEFIWHQFCDWYIENSKIIFKNNIISRLNNTCYTLFFILENSLKMLHPFIPFITEEIWKNLSKMVRNERKNTTILEFFPKKYLFLKKDNSFNEIECIKNIITCIRKLKFEKKTKFNKLVDVCFINNSYEEKIIILNNIEIIKNIAFVKNVDFSRSIPKNVLKKDIKIINNIKIYIYN